MLYFLLGWETALFLHIFLFSIVFYAYLLLEFFDFKLTIAPFGFFLRYRSTSPCTLHSSLLSLRSCRERRDCDVRELQQIFKEWKALRHHRGNKLVTGETRPTS